MRYFRENEYRYIQLLVLSALAFSFWFYLYLNSQERFSLAHGYGSVSQLKEILGILGISFAFIAALIYHQTKKTPASLLLTAGLGFLVLRSLLHSTHMVNAMEQNISLFEAIFEGENHFLQSLIDASGAFILLLGVITLFNWKGAKNRILGSVLIVEVGLFALILSNTKGDLMLLLNNMMVSHGMALLPAAIAAMPIISFLVLSGLVYKLFTANSSDFKRLLLLGFGLILLRSIVHGVHTIFGLETHFFQSGFDLLGGTVLGVAFFEEIDKEKSPSADIWIISGMFLAFAITYAIFTFFKLR